MLYSFIIKKVENKNHFLFYQYLCSKRRNICLSGDRMETGSGLREVGGAVAQITKLGSGQHVHSRLTDLTLRSTLTATADIAQSAQIVPVRLLCQSTLADAADLGSLGLTKKSVLQSNTLGLGTLGLGKSGENGVQDIGEPGGRKGESDFLHYYSFCESWVILKTSCFLDTLLYIFSRKKKIIFFYSLDLIKKDNKKKEHKGSFTFSIFQ